MARQAIPQDNYMSAIEKMIKDGARIDEVTPTRLQKEVGGQYARCVQIVDDYRASAQDQRMEEEEAPMPAWHKDAVATITKTAEGIWVKIYSEMKKSHDELTAAFTEKRSLLESQIKEALQQIDHLEDIVERQAESLAKIKDESVQLGLDKARIAGEFVATQTEHKELVARYTAIEKEKSSVAADFKVTLAVIELHKKKEEELEEKIKDSSQLGNRAVIAEARIQDLETCVSELKSQIAKANQEKFQEIKESKEVQAAAIKADNVSRDTISTLEKQVAVADERSTGLAEQLRDFKLQIEELKKKDASQVVRPQVNPAFRQKTV